MNADTPAAARTRIIVDAVMDFLDSLDVAQRSAAQFPFAPQKTATAARFMGGKGGRMTFVGEQYGDAIWSNFPVDDVPRPGLRFGSLSPASREAAWRVLQTLLSAGGRQKVLDIMDSDQVLAERGTPYASGTACYTLGVFGTPNTMTPWMLQFGGHHLALNAVVAGSNVSLTPVLTGACPALFTRDGRTIRPLGGEHDTAFRLVNALSAAQRQKAILSDQVGSLLLGPGHDRETLPPEGLPAAEMTEAQRGILLDLIGEWAGLLNPDHTAPKLAQVREGLDSLHFAWKGRTDDLSPVYFRIAGPTMQIEFAHQMGDRNHIHTVYRDPLHDYGRVWT